MSCGVGGCATFGGCGGGWWLEKGGEVGERDDCRTTKFEQGREGERCVGFRHRNELVNECFGLVIFMGFKSLI